MIGVCSKGGDDGYHLGGEGMRSQRFLVTAMAADYDTADTIAEHVRRIVNARFATSPGFERTGVDVSDFVERTKAFSRAMEVKVSILA